MTADTITAIKKALEGVTPGPWELCAHLKHNDACSCGYRGVIYGPEPDGYAICQPGHEPAPEGQEGTEPPRYPRDVEIANMRYIAAVNPEAISEILSTLESLQSENEERKVRIEKLEQTLKAVTGNKIGFTYEPTGERVNLYSPNPSAFAIVAQHPEILQAIVGARADIEGPAALSSTGDTHGN